ncbi:hypothetical protein J521_2995 [Acinetobacter baumannii 1035119]|nr:hypothetical protein J521_2995 [Acinetobacter baumannii 1035119]
MWLFSKKRLSLIYINYDIHKASMTAKGLVQVNEAFFILSLFVQFRG